MRFNRSINFSSLAFIDVMSCGLGAVILLFIILDFKTSNENDIFPLIEIFPPTKENDNKAINNTLLEQKLSIKNQMNDEQNKIKQLSKSISELLILKVNQNIELDSISQKIKNQSITDYKTTDNLIGLNVKGKRILIALDTSASMASRELIKIITGISDQSGKRLSSGEKWKQAKKVLIWAVKNAPESGEINVLNYSDTVKQITPKWINKNDALITVQKKINDLSPNGGTSLGKLLEYIADIPVVPTDIYIITDGLPTMSGDKRSSLDALKKCIKLPFSNNNYIEGPCREALFVSAVQRFQNNSTSKINIILLPLEGDPKAAPYYWIWSNLTNGVFLSPTKDWPLT